MESNNNRSSTSKLMSIVIAVLVCCACVVILGAVGLVYCEYRGLPTIAATPFTPPPTIENESAPSPLPSPEPTLELTRPPVDSIIPDTLQTLQTIIVPENDPYDLACRLQGICNVAKTLPAPAAPLQVGDKQKFWLLNTDTNENFQIGATLIYITPHSYFWVKDGVDVNKNDVKELMNTFEDKIYPTDRKFFGSEWIPGVDNDPHIYVIYGANIGSHVAGYFSTSNEFNPAIRKDSNGHETYVINANQDLGFEYTYTTLAHEFVHMIQFPSDRNDVAWISEGFAEVGAFLNGYNVGGADWGYVQNPDLQLNDWVAPSSPDFGPHYGQSFLYLAYFLDRFGAKATQALTKNPKNDLVSVDDTLQSLNITDPQTGKVITADDVFMDWAVTMYLKDGAVGDGRFIYHNYPDAPQTSDTEMISHCPNSLSGTVNQYGIDYINVRCRGDHILTFTGSTVAGLLPVVPASGKYAFWSNKGDESDMTLTREFDLSNVSGPVTLAYQTWYDLEKDYDYLYLETSTDGGKTWQFIETPHGRSKDQDPSGNAYGWGYSGKSNGWIEENVDLSKFAGQKVQIRFEYVTDAEVNGEGLLLDNVKVDAINYFTDFETDNGGWTANGFARVDNVLPQTYRLSLIIKGNTTTVTNIPVNSDQTAVIPLSLKRGEEAVLIITGTTRFTRIPASYQIEIK